MTKPLYKTKSFWLVVAALLLIANCAVVWLMGTVKSAETTTTLYMFNRVINAGESGTGWSWDGSTLTLNSDYTGPANVYEYNDRTRSSSFWCYSVIAADGDLTIKLDGDVQITAHWFEYGEGWNTVDHMNNTAIIGSANLTFCGKGTMTINGNLCQGEDSVGIFLGTSKQWVDGAPPDTARTNYNLTFSEQCKVIVKGGESQDLSGANVGSSYGIYSKGNVVVKDSAVLEAYGGNPTGNGNSCAIYALGAMTSSGSSRVTATAGSAPGTGRSDGINLGATFTASGTTIVTAQAGTSTSADCVGILANGHVLAKDNSRIVATGGTTTSGGNARGIESTASEYNVEANGYGTIIARGGSASESGNGSCDGIFQRGATQAIQHGTIEAYGGTAIGNWSCGISTVNVGYVRLSGYGTVKAVGGVTTDVYSNSVGIRGGALEMTGGTLIAEAGTAGQSNCAVAMYIPNGTKSYIRGGNAYFNAAASNQVSYGIWTDSSNSDGQTLEISGGVVRIDGATQSFSIPAGNLIGTPNRYSVYSSSTYGTKGTTATDFSSYSINSGHKRVDIEPTGYIGYSVPYLDANGVQQRCYVARSIESANTGTGYKFGDSGKTTWYAVTGNTTISSVSRAMGDAHLILCDGQTLNCTTYGIQVLTDENDVVDSLTIYSQSLGSSMGTLNATNSIREGEAYNGAAIGGAILLGVDSSGNSSTVAYNGGNITINGGNINAHGGVGAAGIGGCYLMAAGAITINNGIVYADGGHFSAGIGGGDTGTATSITIKGGRVTSIGHGRAAGIGGGGSGWSTTPSLGGGVINITGGYVVANGGVGYNNSPEYNNPNTSGFQPRRIPTAIGDGIGNLDTSIEGVKAKVTISNAIVAVDRQHKTNVRGEDYYTISNNVFYIEDFYNMYDRTYDFTTETWSEEHVPNYQVVLYPRSGGNVYYLPQDINLPANMTLTLQSGQSIDANGHTFTNGGKILVEEGGIVTDVIRNGNIYYEIVYKSTIGADKISLARNDGLVVNGCSFTETRNDPNSTRDFTTTVTPTNVREFGIPGKTIQVNPAAGSFMRFDTSPATTVRPITNSSARQFTMPSQVTTLINPRQTLFFGGDGIINKGEIYTDMSGSTTSIDLLANGSFTTRFTPHYFYSGVNFVFDPGLPAGTKLVLMDRSKAVQGKGMVYSYTTTAASTTTIPASSFTLMKDGSPLSTADVTVNAESATVFQLSVELPDKNIAAGAVTYTVTMQDGGSPTKEVKAVCATYNPGTLTLTLHTVTPGAFTTKATVGNVIGDGNVLAVELLSGSGSVISLPAGTQITVDGKLPVEYANDRYYFSGIASGKHTISLANMVGGTYQVRAYLCESPRTPAYPMMESITTATTASATVPAIPADAVKLTSDDRVIDKALGESGLTLTLTTSASTTATLGTPVVHVQSSDGNFTAAAGITVTRTDTGYSVSAASAHEGLYRITLTYGDATTYFYFIVAI